jgi:serine/threonine-protein kinase
MGDEKAPRTPPWTWDKVLPEEFGKGDERVARFEREAKLLSSLNRPNIAGIYGPEESNGVKALVLELVEGPTPADRIARGLIPIEETLPIAKQVAGALEELERLAPPATDRRRALGW